MGRPSRYPEEFRREAVALALSSEESRAAVARRLGVNETTLRNWCAAQLAEEARQADPLAVAAAGDAGAPGFTGRGSRPPQASQRGTRCPRRRVRRRAPRAGCGDARAACRLRGGR